MENSEIPRPSLDNLEVLRKNGEELDGSQQVKAETSRSKTREMENFPRKNRARSTKKENRNEVSVEDQACEEQYQEILKELQSQHFVMPADKLKDPSKCEGSPFYCELCAVKLANIESCQNHVRTKAHKKLKKSKGELLSLSRISPPSQPQILALSRLLESIFLEHGLCPVKDLPRRQDVAKHVSKTVHSTHPECSVSIYGSSFTGFGLKESDVNLDLVIPDEVNVPHVLLSILDLLQKDENYSDVKSEFDAKVPRILFRHVPSGLDCELSPGNGKASKTSCLLKKYSDVDPCVKILIVGLRYWARVCGVDCQSEGGLPGYSFALMVIQFLQETKPPLLPRWTPSEVVDDDNTCLSEDFISYNKDEIGSLWFQLFRFYCIDFDIPNLVITVKEPMPFSREAKKWGYRRIAIEDPFSSKRNVASSLSSDKVFEYFFTCWKNSFRYFGSLPSDPQKKPVAKVPNNNLTMCANQTKNDALQSKKPEGSFVNEEEAIFEMEDLDHTTKQIQCMKLSIDGASQTQIAKDSPSLTSKNNGVSEDEIEITLSDSDSEEVSELRNQTVEAKETSGDSRDAMEAVNKTIDMQDVVYRFDAQVFRGNNKPVKTCCYCKEDGHTKVQCPELRKPTLRVLPPMTAQFGNVLNYVCKTSRADFEFEKSEVGYREKVLQNLEEYIHSIFPGARLFLFGSSRNGFGFKNSDIDICMTLENQEKEEVDAVDVITKLAKLLKKHKDCANVLAITTAKVPIVKFFLRSCKREADISLYNILALENTAMLATYAKLDDRVATLGYTVKVFAKVCDIGDASKGSLSSYAYILMLLHYLQQCKPPVVPILQNLYTDNKQPEKIIDGWNCWFCRDLMEIKRLWNQKEKNTLNAGLLWYGFLRYYTEEFDFEHDVVCCRRTKKLTKFEKMWTKHAFAIEDPFNLDHNLGAGVTRKMANYITSTLIKGRERFGFPRYDIPEPFLQRYFFDVYFLTDGYEAPTDRNCRICGKIGHIAKDCPHSKSNRRAEQKKEADERKAVTENDEKFDLSRKPFNVGPSRPRSASVPNKQEQKRGEASNTPLPAAQINTNVTSIPKSQPDAQFVSSPVKEGHSIKPRDNPESSPEMPPSKVPHTQSDVHNLPTDFTNKNVALTGAGGEIVDPNNTHTKPEISQVASAAIINETGNQTSLPGLHPPGSSNNDCTGNQYNSAASATPQTSSSVALPHSQRASSPPNHPQGVNPPPGFYLPEGTRQVPHASSVGYPHSMAGGLSPSPPVNKAPAFEGQPIVRNAPQHQPSMFSPQSGQFAASPSRHEMWLRQQELMLLHQHSPPVRPLVPYPLTPEVQVPSPLHQWRCASDSFPMQHVGSPVHAQQRLAEHNRQVFSCSPPNISRSVLWPVATNSPPSLARGQQCQGHGLPFSHVSSSGMPVPQHMTHPRFSQGNSHVVPSPQEIAQQLQFTHSPGMPSPVLGSPPQRTLQQPVPQQDGQGNSHGALSPQPIAQQIQFTHSPGMPSPVLGSPPQHTLQQPVLQQEGQRNSHGALSPQPIAQQIQFSHSPSMPSPVLGSPPQHILQQPVPHQDLKQSAFGTHMTGDQFINLMRVVEDESKKSESVPTKLSSDEFEPKDFTRIPPKDVKVAKTPEEHKLLTKLSKVKSLWEGNTSPGVDNSCPNPDTVDTGYVTLHEQSDMVNAEPDTKFSTETEPRRTVPDKDSANDEEKTAHTDQEEKEKSVPSSITDKSARLSKALDRSDFSSAGNVASDEKLQMPSSTSVNESEQTSVQTQMTAAMSPTPKQFQKPKPTRRGGRGRKSRGSRRNEADKNALEKPEEKAVGDRSDKQQKNYDDFKVAALRASPSAKKPRGEVKHGDTQEVGRGSESRPRQMYQQKGSPGDKKRPERNKPQGARAAGPANSPGNSNKGGKGGASKQKDSPKSVHDGDKRPEANAQSKRAADTANSPGCYKGDKGGASKQKDYPTNVNDGYKKGSEASAQSKRAADPANSPGYSKGDKGGASKQKDSPTSVHDGYKKGSEASAQSKRAADPANSPGYSKGDKGGTSKQQDYSTSVNDGFKKGPEASAQSKRAADPANSPGYSTKGGKGRTTSRRRRPQSHTKSEGADGEKDDYRQRSNSAPEKHPSKNS